MTQVIDTVKTILTMADGTEKDVTRWKCYAWTPCNGKRSRLTYVDFFTFAETRREARANFLKENPIHAGRFISAQPVK